MPRLDLTSDAFTFPTPFDCEIVAATMLWPDDAAMRQQAFDAYCSAFAGSAWHFVPMTRPQKESLISLCATAPRLADIRKAAVERFRKCRMAGQILRLALGNGGSMAAIMERVSKADSGRARKLNDIWTEFRPVSHLWAAYLARIVTVGRDDWTLPCRADALRDFLAEAENFRRKGESTRLRQAPGTVLDALTMASLPAVIEHLAERHAAKFTK